MCAEETGDAARKGQAKGMDDAGGGMRRKREGRRVRGELLGGEWMERGKVWERDRIGPL